MKRSEQNHAYFSNTVILNATNSFHFTLANKHQQSYLTMTQLSSYGNAFIHFYLIRIYTLHIGQ